MSPSARKPQAKRPAPTKPAAKTPVAKKAPATKTAARKPVARKPATGKSTASKPPTRTVARVSPLRGMDVERYIESKIAGWQQGAARRIVALVARVAPSSSVSIKWSQPVFEQNGPFAFLRAAKAHLTVGFWRGAELPDAPGFERGDRMGNIKFKDAAQVDERLLESLVRAAVRLNLEKGNPTRRG